MANRIKSISKYSGTAWGTETPIGADAANVDLATSYTTVTESTATSGATAEAAIGKIHTDTTNLKKAGHGNGTVTNYDSTSGETSKVLTTDCVVAASDDTATAWSKFNRFRRRVSNKFADYFLKSNLVTSSTGVTTTGADTTVYTTKAINNYLANVVGYTDNTAPEAGTIASQLSTLNDNAAQVGSMTRPVYLGTSWAGDANVTTLAYPGCLLCFYYFLTIGSYGVTTAYGYMYTMNNIWILASPEKYIPDGTVYSVRGLTVSIKGNGHDFAANINYDKSTLTANSYTRGIRFNWMNSSSYTVGPNATIFATAMFVDN